MDEPNKRFYKFGPFCVDSEKRVLLREGEAVPLAPKAFDTLLILAQHPGEVLEKDRLIEMLWPDSIVEEGNLTVNISAIRRALGESPNERKYIVTIPGKGYKFAADLSDDTSDLILARYTKSTVVIGDEGESQEVKQKQEGLATASLSSTGRRKIVYTGVAVAILVVGVAGLYYLRLAPGSTVSTPPVRSIAVLPFKPLVADHRDESLEMGIADTLIAKISHISEIAVRPLGSVRRYGGLEQDPLDAGRQLGVEAVLDGTIQRAGDRVGVTARLIRVADGGQLWQGRFDAPFTDIFSVQDSISQKVAGSLRAKLTSAEETRLASHYTENVEAYQLYLRGRYHALKRTLPETQKAISYFQHAIALDSSYALAYVGLADAYLSSLAADLPPNKFLPQARDAAQRAVEIDDTLADAHAELGFIIFWYDWDWDASEKQFRRALELDPNNANAHLFYAHMLSNTGRHAEALAEAKRARELDPLNLLINALEGQFLIHAGRTDEALERLQETLELDPNYFLARYYASSAYIDRGMYSEAVNEARKAMKASGARGTHSAAFLGYALAKSGRKAEALSVLEGLMKSSADRYVSAYNIALVHNGLGKGDEALAWLERACAQRLPHMVFLKVEPKWNNLRPDPRFQDLLRRVGLPQ
ncbi:MAG TPA: winged helix-turn-helix domain-containing protein [Blastocatellia bacterium]|nr:winged helix-turn-helix domain-containing protein [Blastocatellia bacterium]